MFNTSLDILYFSLAIGFIVLVIFLSITLMYAIFVLRDVSKITDKVTDIVDRVNDVVVAPLKFLHMFMDHVKPFIDKMREKGAKRKRDEE